MKERSRNIKKKLLYLLEQDDIKKALAEIENFPLKTCIGPLFSFFLHKDEHIRWRAVAAMGVVVSQLASSDMEAARVVMRRLMWSLNDESGGIGWGSPEAMGEIMARNQALAQEYSNILVSYISPGGNYLEYEMLQRGALWGFGRLAHTRPELLFKCESLLIPYMSASDPYLKGFSAWAAGPLDTSVVQDFLQKLLEDHSKIKIFLDLRLVERKVSQLADESLESVYSKQ